MNEQEMQTLVRKRGSVKAKLTGFTNFVNILKAKEQLEDVDIFQLEERLNKIVELLEEFGNVQSIIESIAQNVEEQYLEREAFEQNYYSQVALARKLVNDNTERQEEVDKISTRNSVKSANSVSNSGRLLGIKLPTIQLPKFKGDLLGWLEFRDTFQSLIHDNTSINDIQKFHYLRASLEGSAAQIIKSIGFTSKNYQIAWNLLRERFDNTRLLVYNHVKALFNLETISKESAEMIRNLIDSISKHLRALEQLQQPTSQWDTLVIYMVSTKLDPITSREWEKFKGENELPTLENLKIFLKNRADLLETLEVQNQSEKKNLKQHSKGFFSGNASGSKCTICMKEHLIYNCPEFLKLSIQERIQKAQSMKLCRNCLKHGHYSKVCRSSMCRRCNLKHNTLLHLEHEKSKTNGKNSAESNTKYEDGQKNAEQGDGNSQNVSLSASSVIQQVLLSTAYLQVLDKNGYPHTIRALLDSGSMSNFITKELCDKLKLNTTRVEFAVAGLNQTLSKIELRCEATIQALHNAYKENITCYVLPEITGTLPSITIDASQFEIPKNIKLADPTFYKPEKVEMLIGAEHFWKLICIGQISLGVNKPILQKTKFGWILSGSIAMQQSNKMQCSLSQNINIQRQLSRFWEIEEGFPIKSRSKEENDCETYFQKTTKRQKDGRFIVSIPFKDSLEKLGESREFAEKRFLSLERKLQKNEKLKKRYIQFMSEYEELGHMTEAQQDGDSKFCYFLPHHGVVREESLTTKLRVVFDASAVTTSGYSLNDLQMVGPTIQDDLLSILLRFRQHAYVISGDIAKMYRQVLVEPTQRPLQSILWRASPNEKLRVFHLNTVTYGTAAAAYLAIRCIYQLSKEVKDTKRDIARIIERDFYVDDLLTGADSIEDAALICKEVTDTLRKGCFELRKFYSNEEEVLKYVKKEDSMSTIVELGINENTKTLGLIWRCQTDDLTYVINPISDKQRATKRTILSCIAQIFDPLGLLSPCTVTAKIILQKLWLEKLSWDEALPSSIYTTWSVFREQLSNLNDISIERHALCQNAVDVQLHGFSDASENAYGGAIFMRSTDRKGDVSVHLLCAKTKIAPLKTITLPRLELCGALILARLAHKVISSLNLKFDRCVFWTDSTIVISWLKMLPNSLKTFVSTRVAEIQQLTDPGVWRHVPTKDNPADLLSRGISPDQLKHMRLWWHGPPWLIKEEIHWPNLTISSRELPELKRQIQAFTTGQEVEEFPFQRFSNFETLKRVVAYLYRFKENCKRLKELRQSGPLSVTELRDALKALIRIAQRKSLSEEYELLSKGKEISKKSRILNLNPFLDSENIIRVGGRLDSSKFSFDKKHPILLCATHHMTKLLFMSEHARLLHGGPQLILASIRERFWPLSGRNLARKVVKECVKCFRNNPRTVGPIMGNLPESRLLPGPPFSTTGIDYAGPFQIKDRKGRGSRINKCYVALFICFATKAIHLELVTELTKDAFILALRRFVSRRGKPVRIFSDNGTNFVAAASELRDFGIFLKGGENDLIEHFSQQGIDWKFIPPHSPHFGGLWEAGVKSSKYHLKRVLGNAHLTFEEFYTVLVQVEAVLNSRPLFPMSSDPNDFTPLTPAHFLIGRPLTAIPSEDFKEVPLGRLSRFQLVQQMQQHFWCRWHKEYVSELQQRTRWRTTQGKLQPGDMVVLKDDNAPPLKWKLGRILKVHPGKDGVARVASIKTSCGEIKRSFAKICPLPSSNSKRDEVESGYFQGGGHVQAVSE